MTCAVITAMKLVKKKVLERQRVVNSRTVSVVTFEISVKTNVLHRYANFFGKDILRKFRDSLSAVLVNVLN